MWHSQIYELSYDNKHHPSDSVKPDCPTWQTEAAASPSSPPPSSTWRYTRYRWTLVYAYMVKWSLQWISVPSPHRVTCLCPWDNDSPASFSFLAHVLPPSYTLSPGGIWKLDKGRQTSGHLRGSRIGNDGSVWKGCLWAECARGWRWAFGLLSPTSLSSMSGTRTWTGSSSV